jgi:catalase
VSNLSQPPAEVGRQRLGPAGKLVRLALVGVALAAVLASFFYLGGWLTPDRLTPARFVDGLQQADGLHPGFRRNHAKGVCVSGVFESNGTGAKLSKAAVFAPGRVSVVGRFSLGGGNPDQADAAGAVRGLGLQFSPAEGEVWRMAMVNLPVFVVKTPEAFYERLLASRPDPKTGKPDPAQMEAFLDRHPETAAAFKIIKAQPPASGFADSTFHGLNAFRFINAASVSTPVRWLFRPEQPAGDATPADAAATGKNYLFDGLIAQMHGGPLQWHLIVVVGQPGDPTDDATLPWPDEREQVDVGILTLDRIESDQDSPTSELNFDPLVLPAGIAASDDPLLSPRSAIYSQSFTRRAGEPQQPSPISPAEVRKGE